MPRIAARVKPYEGAALMSEAEARKVVLPRFHGWGLPPKQWYGDDTLHSPARSYLLHRGEKVIDTSNGQAYTCGCVLLPWDNNEVVKACPKHLGALRGRDWRTGKYGEP